MKIRKFFLGIANKISSPQVKVLLVIIFIVCFVWCIRTMEKTYLHTIKIKPHYSFSNAQGIDLTDASDEKIEIKVKINGFGILSYHFFEKTIGINLSSCLQQSGKKYFWLPAKHKELISPYLLKGTFIDHFISDTISLELSKIKSKRVPVSLKRVKFNYQKAYDSFDKNIVSPQFVTIYAAERNLSQINSIELEDKLYENINKPISDTLSFIIPNGYQNIRIEPQKAVININPELFTEKKLLVKIKGVNTPEAYRAKFFPSSVELIFKVPVAKYESVNSKDFEVLADVSSSDSLDRSVYLSIQKSPEVVKQVRLERQKVLYTLVKQ